MPPSVFFYEDSEVTRAHTARENFDMTCSPQTTKGRRSKNFHSSSGAAPCPGLTKTKLTRNSRNAIVSTRKHRIGKETWSRMDATGPKGWLRACKLASETLGDWPVPIRKSSRFYKLARDIYEQGIEEDIL